MLLLWRQRRMRELARKSHEQENQLPEHPKDHSQEHPAELQSADPIWAADQPKRRRTEPSEPIVTERTAAAVQKILVPKDIVRRGQIIAPDDPIVQQYLANRATNSGRTAAPRKPTQEPAEWFQDAAPDGIIYARDEGPGPAEQNGLQSSKSEALRVDDRPRRRRTIVSHDQQMLLIKWLETRPDFRNILPAASCRRSRDRLLTELAAELNALPFGCKRMSDGAGWRRYLAKQQHMIENKLHLLRKLFREGRVTEKLTKFELRVVQLLYPNWADEVNQWTAERKVTTNNIPNQVAAKPRQPLPQPKQSIQISRDMVLRGQIIAKDDPIVQQFLANRTTNNIGLRPEISRKPAAVIADPDAATVFVPEFQPVRMEDGVEVKVEPSDPLAGDQTFCWPIEAANMRLWNLTENDYVYECA